MFNKFHAALTFVGNFRSLSFKRRLKQVLYIQFKTDLCQVMIIFCKILLALLSALMAKIHNDFIFYNLCQLI